MAELVDALVSGTSERKFVEVRVLFWAPSIQRVAVESSRSEGIRDGTLQNWPRLRAMATQTDLFSRGYCRERGRVSYGGGRCPVIGYDDDRASELAAI